MTNSVNGGLSLLYVEDDPETRKLIGTTLATEYPNFAIHIAADGAEGLALFREHRPELVITDIRMPVMDGIRMAGEIKAIDAEIAVIALTAYTDTSFLLSAVELGFSHYVMKPIDFDRLFESIEKSLQVLALKRQVNEQNEEIRQFAAVLEKRVEERTKELEASRAEVEKRNLKLGELTIELKTARDRYWNLYNWSPLGYLSIDEQFIIREINITGAKMLGSRRNSLLGTSMELYLSQENMALLSESFQECVQAKHALTELRITVEGRKHLFVQLHCVPYIQQGSDVKLYRSAIIDITKLKEAEDALLRETVEKVHALQELREKDQILVQQSHFAAMGELMSNIAHHWRQPLNNLGLIIQGLPIMCTGGASTLEPLEENVAKAMDVINRLSRTISDFSYFYNPIHQGVTFRASNVMSRAVSLIEASLREQNLNLEVASEGDVTIEGNERDFFQVFLNIVMNTRDAVLKRGVENPRVVVRMFSEDDTSIITIADNAGGISEEIIGRIFDPYFTTKETSHGSGVGLYMAKIIIEKNLNGLLSVRNIGGGAEFRIELNSNVFRRSAA